MHIQLFPWHSTKSMFANISFVLHVQINKMEKAMQICSKCKYNFLVCFFFFPSFKEIEKTQAPLSGNMWGMRNLTWENFTAQAVSLGPMRVPGTGFPSGTSPIPAQWTASKRPQNATNKNNVTGHPEQLVFLERPTPTLILFLFCF